LAAYPPVANNKKVFVGSFVADHLLLKDFELYEIICINVCVCDILDFPVILYRQ
jgi:hypothetical protein